MVQMEKYKLPQAFISIVRQIEKYINKLYTVMKSAFPLRQPLHRGSHLLTYDALPFTSTKSLATQSLNLNMTASLPSLHHFETSRIIITSNEPSFKILEENPFSLKGKLKRNTLPTQLQPHLLRGLLSPSHIASINRKINFTYKSPTEKAPTNLKTQSNLFICPSPEYGRPVSKMEQQQQRLRKKRIRNKLCSSQFSYAYPLQATFEQFKCILTSSQQKIEASSQTNQLYSLNTQSRINLVSQSKIASTKATQSFYKQNRSNDFLIPTDSNRKSNSEINIFRCNSNRSLLERVPTAKQLGQTVILHNYSFGGIIDQPNTLGKPSQSRIESRKDIFSYPQKLPNWCNNIRGLIDIGNSSDLKESIHCGPQIQAERPRFDMLDGFGRQIKESTLSCQQ